MLGGVRSASRSRVSSTPPAVATGKITTARKGMASSRKHGTANPSTRQRRRCMAVRRWASRGCPRRSKLGPISSKQSIQPPKQADITGTTVWPTTGMNWARNNGIAASSEMTIKSTDCLRARGTELVQDSSVDVSAPDSSASTASLILS